MPYTCTVLLYPFERLPCQVGTNQLQHVARIEGMVLYVILYSHFHASKYYISIYLTCDCGHRCTLQPIQCTGGSEGSGGLVEWGGLLVPKRRTGLLVGSVRGKEARDPAAVWWSWWAEDEADRVLDDTRLCLMAVAESCSGEYGADPASPSHLLLLSTHHWYGVIFKMLHFCLIVVDMLSTKIYSFALCRSMGDVQQRADQALASVRGQTLPKRLDQANS